MKTLRPILCYIPCPFTLYPYSTLTQAQVHEIAEALEHIDLGQHGNLIDATTELLVASSLSSWSSSGTDAGIPAKNHTTTSTSSTISGWLLTLAHMPSVRQDCLFKTMSQLQSSASQARVETTQAVTTAKTAQAEPRETVLAVTETDTKTATAASKNVWHMGSAHLDHLDLCELLLTQWISRGYVKPQVRRSFEQTMAAMASSSSSSVPPQAAQDAAYNHPGALAALALAVFWPKHSRTQCVALYVSLLRGLHEKLGHKAPEALVESLNALLLRMQSAQSSESSKSALPTFPPNTFYESLAWAADDLQTAVRLHEMYASTIALQTPPPPQPYWNINFWDKFAGRLGTALDASTLTPGQVCHALDLVPRSKYATQAMNANRATTKSSRIKMSYKPARELGEATVGLVEKLAVHFALAPNMPPRRALRSVELCRAVLTSNAGKKSKLQAMKASLPTPISNSALVPSLSLSSPTVLRALFHLVTRDLDNAMPGRTSRLKWFLAIVARERGLKAATECERALVRWRDAVKQYNRREGMRIRREDWEMLEQLK